MALHEMVLSWRLGLTDPARLVLDLALIVSSVYAAMALARASAKRGAPAKVPTDRMLRIFVLRTITGGGWFVIVFAVLWRLGINVTALLGGVAVGGFILGFALKDTLGNLASGLLLLVYRPLNIGETVRLGDHEGTVIAVGMALTVLETPDGNTVSVPNNAVLGQAIVNRTRSPMRRIDVDTGLSNRDDIPAALQAGRAAGGAFPEVLTKPKAVAVVTGLTSDGPSLKFGFWVKNEDFGRIRPLLLAEVKKRLDAIGASTQTPSLEVMPVKGPVEPGEVRILDK